jgi:YidC/Oxa1 family membrane protein insertase
MRLIETVHLTLDIPYWGAIIATTIGLRIFLLPIAIKTVQNASRMAVMRPEMQKIQDALTKDPNFEDIKVKTRYQNEMRALFVKFKVNPFRSVLLPLFQLPIFISFFFGLKEMGTFFPALSTGGAYWFTNLTAADPYMIFPIANAISFLLMVEMGSDGLQTGQQESFKWGMRGLAAAMAPLTMSIPQGVFVYWSTNNALSVVQTIILKQEAIRAALDIPKPPPAEEQKAVKIKSPFATFAEAVQKERNYAKAKPEIVDGTQVYRSNVVPPPPPPVTTSVPPKIANKKSST